MEEDTPRRDRRSTKPPAALFVSPVAAEDEAPSLPHQSLPARERPATEPFTAAPPTESAPPTAPAKRARTVPEQLTFADAELPATRERDVTQRPSPATPPRSSAAEQAPPNTPAAPPRQRAAKKTGATAKKTTAETAPSRTKTPAKATDAKPRKATAETAPPQNKAPAKRTMKRAPAVKEATGAPPPKTGKQATTPAATSEITVEKAPMLPNAAEATVGPDFARTEVRTRADLPSDADLTRAVQASPRLAPAALAVAAVGRFGESAREQAEWLRRTYPRVSPERLAHEAVRVAGRRVRYSVGTSLIGGPIGIAAGVSTITWAHARLVIDIAAVFGRDPLDPARAAELLALLGVYPDPLAARAAVSELAGDLADIAGTDAKASGPLLVSATAALLTRAASRILPGAAVLVTVFRSTSETERLANRAIRFYRRT